MKIRASKQDKIAKLFWLSVSTLLLSAEAHAFSGPVIRSLNFIKSHMIQIGMTLGVLAFFYAVSTIVTPNPRWKLLILSVIGVGVLAAPDVVTMSIQGQR